MALPTLRLPMHRSSRRDDSLSLAHNSRHAEYSTEGSTSFSSHSDRRHQRNQHQTVGNGFRPNQPISRNGSSSRSSSIANYSRFNDNYNESQDSSAVAPRGGQRFAEINGGDRGRNDLMPMAKLARDGRNLGGGSMLDLPRNRIRNEIPGPENLQLNSCRGNYQERLGNNSEFPRFKPLENGPTSVLRKDGNRSQQLQFKNVRKLEGCNTLQDGRDIEAIAPTPAPIKVFDRHGRELTAGGLLVSQPLQSFTPIRSMKNPREDHRPQQHRQNYYHQTSANYQPQYHGGGGGRQNRYDNFYDTSQSLFLGSQQQASCGFPAYNKRPPLHAKREAGGDVNGPMNTYMHDDNFAGNTTFFSTGVDSPPLALNGNCSYYSSGIRKRRLSPPVEMPVESCRDYRSSGSTSSPGEKRKRTTFPSLVLATDKYGNAGKLLDTNLDVKYKAGEVGDDDSAVKNGISASSYHYKKCKLLGRISKNTATSTLPPLLTTVASLPLPVLDDVKSQAEASVVFASVPTPLSVTSVENGGSEANKLSVSVDTDADVVVDKANSLPVSIVVVSSLPVEARTACILGGGENITSCPCILRPVSSEKVGLPTTAAHECCLNTAPASVVSKFIQFKAFQGARDRCKALLTGAVDNPYDDTIPLTTSESGAVTGTRANNIFQVSGPGSLFCDASGDGGNKSITRGTTFVSEVTEKEEVTVGLVFEKDEKNPYEVEHAAFTRKTFVEHFSRLDLLAKLISHAEQWRHLALRPTAKTASPVAGAALKDFDGDETISATGAVSDVTKFSNETLKTSEDEAVGRKASIRDKKLLLLDSPVVDACIQLRSAVEAGKFRTVLRFLRQLYTNLLNNLEATGVYRRALQGYQQRKRDKIVAGSGEESLPKLLLLARSVGSFRRLLTNHRRLTVEKRVDYFLRCAKDCGKLPVYGNVDDALGFAATAIDAVISGALHEKSSSSRGNRTVVAPSTAVSEDNVSSMRDAVRERIQKQLRIGVMMDKVFEQIQKSKREKLLNARSDMCDNQTFLKGLDIVTQTFERVNQRMAWNAELDLLLGYNEIEEKMLRECQAPLNSYERRSMVKAFAEEKFRDDLDTVEFILNMNNVPPLVNPYKPLQPPKVCAFTKSFAAQYAAYRIHEPRKQFNDYITCCTTRWTQSQVELFVSSYRTNPKYWLDIGRNMSLARPNDAVMLYRLLKVSTYQYRQIHKLGGSLLTDADFVGNEAENDSDKNNAGLLRHARPPFSSAANSCRKTPMPFSFFHPTSRPSILPGVGAVKRQRASDEMNAAAETLTLLSHPNKLLKADSSKQSWKDARNASGEAGSFFPTNATSSSATTTTTTTTTLSFSSSTTKKLNTLGSSCQQQTRAEFVTKKAVESREGALVSSASVTAKAAEVLDDENSILHRWSFDLSVVFGRFGSNWHRLTVATNRDVSERYEEKLKVLARREKVDTVALKRERVRALKTAKREARKSGRTRAQTTTAATTTAGSSPTIAEMEEENTTAEAAGEVTEMTTLLADAEMPLVGQANAASQVELIETNDDEAAAVNMTAGLNAAVLMTAAAADALLDLAQAKTIAPLSTLSTLPMMTVAELAAIQTPSSPTTPLSSPPPGYMLFGSNTVNSEPGTPPLSTLSPVVASAAVAAPFEPPPLSPVPTPVVEHKKRGGRRRAADVASNNCATNNNTVSNTNTRSSTSASVVAGAGRGIAKSTTKVVRAAKLTALAAFDGGGRTSYNSAAAAAAAAAVAASAALEATLTEVSDNANSLETYLANKVINGMCSVTSPPSGTVSSAEDDSLTPALTPDVDRLSRAIERERAALAAVAPAAVPSSAAATRRNYLSQQPLPVKPTLKSSASTSSLAATLAATDLRRPLFFANPIPGDTVFAPDGRELVNNKVSEKSRWCSLTPPASTSSNANNISASVPPLEINGPPSSLPLRVSPQRRQPLPTKSDRLAENADNGNQQPPRSALLPPHAVIPAKIGNVASSGSTNVAMDEKMKSQLVLVKGGGRKKLTGNQPGARNQKPLIIASNSDTNVIVQVPDSLPPVTAQPNAQSQPQPLQPAPSTTVAAPANNTESSNFFRTGRHAVTSGGSGSGRVFQPAAGLSNEIKPAVLRRGVIDDSRSRNKTLDAVPPPAAAALPSPAPKVAQQASSTRFPLQVQQQQQTSTFTGSRFVSQTAQQQVTFGGNKGLLRPNTVVASTVTPPAQQKATFPSIATNNAQFFGFPRTAANKRGSVGVDYAADKRNNYAEPTVFGGSNPRFLSTQHHRHQQHLMQQQQQRQRRQVEIPDLAGTHVGAGNMVFQSSIMMGDKKKRSDNYNGGNIGVMPSSSLSHNSASSAVSFPRSGNHNKLLMSQGVVFPSSSSGTTSTVTTKTADLLIDDVLSAYKRSEKRIKTRRAAVAVADEGEFYENVSDTSS